MEESTMNVEVIWRGKKLNVDVNKSWTVGEFGKKLLELTNVKPDTLKLLVPQASGNGSRLLAPFSDDYSSLEISETDIIKRKPVRMMGVFDEEIEEVSQNNMRPDLRIAGFEEEDRRLKQLSSFVPQASLKLPQGSYIFCDFRTLELPGLKLSPPPSKALRIMHGLACDPGIIAIMNKHRWRVGIMTELAPVGYVGISPKCVLGFNKNHGEEISLRLRTDDLKGFRKYESIKKTLLHELAHMVHSEHDVNFLALEKQLNEESASLDWSKSRSYTLSSRMVSNHYEDADHVSVASDSGHKLGGSHSFTDARASSIAAAHHRYISSSLSALSGFQAPNESLQVDAVNDDERFEYFHDNKIAEPDLDDALMSENKVANLVQDHILHENLIDQDLDNFPKETLFIETNDSAIPRNIITDLMNTQPQFDNNTVPRPTNDLDFHSGVGSEDPTPDNEDEMISQESGREAQQQSTSSLGMGLLEDEPELQRIEESVTAISARIQESIRLLRSELPPHLAVTILQTLSKIIRNVIEHPNEPKFKRIRKTNALFQRNVASYKAAMDILNTVGFSEDIGLNEVGEAESYLLLKRNDPGLLWLAKSSIDVYIFESNSTGGRANSCI